MNVRELIEKLADVPGETIVLARGYEGGEEEIDTVDITTATYNPERPWYYGLWEVNDEGAEKFLVVRLGSMNKPREVDPREAL